VNLAADRAVEVAHLGGAVNDLRIELPVGRVTVLRGDNEVGKSSALEALRALLTGQGSLEVSRGHSSGFVRGFGAEVRATEHRTTRSGDPEVRIIHGGDPRHFVAPRGEKPEARDAERLKLLIRLTGAEIPETAWIGLFGDDEEAYRAVAKSDTIGERDPLEKARMLKRDVEVQAREQERRAETERARASGIRQAVADVKLDMPSDERELAANLAARSSTLARLEGDRKAANQRAAAFGAARAALERAADERGGQSSAKALVALDAAEIRHVERAEAERLALDATRVAERALADAKGALEIARQATRHAEARVQNARADVASAKAAETSIESARRVVEAGSGDAGPTDAQIEEARAAVEIASKGVQYGALARDAFAKLEQADEAAALANHLEAKAGRFRELARGCDGVLTAAIAKIAPAGLSIEGGRLRIERDGVEELVDDLSDGARADLALRIMSDAARPGGVVILDQGFWESIGPKRRAELIERVAGLRVSVLTAECSQGGELRAETLDAGTHRLERKPVVALFDDAES
jgi:hypothetical protein